MTRDVEGAQPGAGGRSPAAHRPGSWLVEGNRQRASLRREELDAVARQRGYRDLEELVRATAALKLREVSVMLGRSESTVSSWRTRFGVSGAQSVTAAGELRQREGLEGLPLGVQPVDAQGRLRCRICGVWRDALGEHARRAHQVSTVRYRERFGLAATETLANPAAVQRQAAAVAEGWRRTLTERYTAAAVAGGHSSLAALLDQDDDEVARVLGVKLRTVLAIRSRQ